MKNEGYATSFAVDRSPEKVFNAINDVRGWWEGEQKITEFIPGRKVVWQVVDSYLDFVKDKSEWKDTDIVFEIGRKDGKTEVCFKHVALVPAYECYDNCSNAWGRLVNGNLRKWIATGKAQPSPW